MSRKRILVYFIIAIVLGAAALGGLWIAMGLLKAPRFGEQVAVVYIQGTMVTGNIPGGLGYATSEDICRSLKNAREDTSVKAIVLRVNSPGGTPAAAQEILTAIKEAQEEGVPVVVSMGDVATSAAYYISAPADVIVANPDSMTGSIGVIWVFENRSGYYSDEGVDFYIAKSGDFKDMGADWRGLTGEEKEYANQVVMSAYERFVNEVAEDRHMSVYRVKELADGRIYLGTDARDMGLIDRCGSMDDAIAIAGELGDIVGTPRVKYMNTPSLSRLLFGSSETDMSQYYLRYLKESPYGYLISST